jgi:hypothetical protein
LLKAYLPQRCYRRRGEGKAHEVYFHSEGLTRKQNRAWLKSRTIRSRRNRQTAAAES